MKTTIGHGRLEDRPGGAEQGLLVAHLDVAPGEEVEEFAVMPTAHRARGVPSPAAAVVRQPHEVVASRLVESGAESCDHTPVGLVADGTAPLVTGDIRVTTLVRAIGRHVVTQVTSTGAFDWEVLDASIARGALLLG